MASNITVSGLVVAPGIQQTYAQWEVDDPNITGLPYLQLDRVELWASETNDRDSTDMLKVAEGITFANYVYTGFAKRYHWIRARDREGQYGDWYPSGATSGAVAGGVWQSYTPTITSSVGSITSYTVMSARYFKIGPNVTFNIDVLVSTVGTGSGVIEFTLPVEASGVDYPVLGVRGSDALAGIVSGSSGRLHTYDGSYPASIPTQLKWGGTYEADE